MARDDDNRPGVLVILLTLLPMAAWAVLFLLTAGGGVMFLSALSKATSAIQEAAAGAVFGAGFVALYVLVRCVEKVAAALVRLKGE